MLCDLAETYHFYSYEGQSPITVAALVFGLGDNSRIKRKISKTKLTLEQILLARILDELAFQSWAQTEDGCKGRNRPKSVLKALLGEDDDIKNEYNSYASGSDFEQAWRTITGG